MHKICSALAHHQCVCEMPRRLAPKRSHDIIMSPAGEAVKHDNCVQVDFDITFRLITANFYNNRGNSSGECCLRGPGVLFWGDALFHRTGVCIPCLAAARPFQKRTFLCHSLLLSCHSSTFITFWCHWNFEHYYVIQKHSCVIRAHL